MWSDWTEKGHMVTVDQCKQYVPRVIAVAHTDGECDHREASLSQLQRWLHEGESNHLKCGNISIGSKHLVGLKKLEDPCGCGGDPWL